jgi:hypothetical protein
VSSAPPTRVEDQAVLIGSDKLAIVNEVPVVAGSISKDRIVAIGLAFGLAIHRRESDGRLVPHVRLGDTEGIVTGYSISPDDRYLAAASTDQRIRIWRVEDLIRVPSSAKSVPSILTLHVTAEGEWALWNEAKCFYAASPKGDAILGIQINRDDKLSEFAPIRTQPSYHRPDIVRAIFTSGSLPGALASLGEPDRESAVELQDRCPTMEVLRVSGARMEGGRWITNSAEVSVVVRVAQEVESVRIAENNIAKNVPFRAMGGTSDRREIPVKLVRGMNRIALVAENKFGNSGRVTVPIELSSPEGSTGTLRVLAIGVSDYEKPGLRPLPFNEKDAQSLAAALKEQDGKIGPVVVTIAKAEQTTKAGVERIVEEWLQTATPEDNMLLFMSAHGMNGSNGQYYMMPKDADADTPDLVASTGVPWKWVLDRLQATECRNAILVQDTCFAGGARFAQAETFASRNNAWRALQDTNLVTFSSSQPNQFSYVDEAAEHSVFTLALLKALRGELSQAVRDGYVWLDRMELEVRDEVHRSIVRLREKGALTNDQNQTPSLFQFERAEVKLSAIGAKR